MHGRHEVLVVDDEPFIRDIFSQLLSDHGFNVQSAASNDEAKVYLSQRSFDLILLDVCMKGMSFYDFISFLKQSPDKCHIPVIAVTALPTEIFPEAKMVLAGILEKPFSPETMMSCIQSVLQMETSPRFNG